MNPKADKNIQDDRGHNEDELVLKDESEDNEWDIHYHDRNKRWRFKEEPEFE